LPLLKFQPSYLSQ